MIRERIAIVPEERALTTYRFWHCISCGLLFSMQTLELPKYCPRCHGLFEQEQCVNCNGTGFR